MLKVTLNKIVPRAYAANFNVPGMFGQFPNIYQDGQVKYLYLDLDKMTTEFLPGVVIPLKPFPGTTAVARKEPGRYSTCRPANTPATWTSVISSPARRFTCRCMSRARCCGPATRMPDRATAK